MDIQIPKEQLRKEKRNKMLRIAIVAGVIAGGAILLFSLFKTGVSEELLKMSTVDRGEIEIAVSGVGQIRPLYEENINSPISTRILAVYRREGDTVDVNTPILKLDLQSVETDYKKMKDEEQMRVLKLQQLKIKRQSQLSEMEMQLKVAQMELNRKAVEWRNEQYLDSLGAGTTDKVKQMELSYNVGKLRLDEDRQRYEYEKQMADADFKVEELDLEIFRRSMSELKRTIDEAAVCAPRKAILTHVNNVIGAQVSKGECLAIVADLTHFKVECTIADMYADRVSVGTLVDVRQGRDTFTGRVSEVTPLSRNGVISFSVSLDDDSDKRLKSGLKCDVYVKSSIKSGVLRVSNGAYYKGKGKQEVFVREGDKLYRREVLLGESNYDYVEVLEGLREGEVIVTNSQESMPDRNTLNIER